MKRIIDGLIMVALFVLLVLLFTGCGKKAGMTTVNKSLKCTVTTDVLQNGIIECDDGTRITVPPNVVINETYIEVPVYIEVPNQCNGPNGDHNNDGHPDNGQGNGH
jgi:hypothetical protein